MPEGDTIHYVARRIRAVLEHSIPDEILAPQARRPVLELMSDARTRSDPALRSLEQDVLSASFDEREFLSRLRSDDPRRPIGDALLDQRTVAGIGNLWKAECCFAAAVDPWRACAQPPHLLVPWLPALSALRANRQRSAR